jgi:hypothetical protein
LSRAAKSNRQLAALLERLAVLLGDRADARPRRRTRVS